MRTFFILSLTLQKYIVSVLCSCARLLVWNVDGFDACNCASYNYNCLPYFPFSHSIAFIAQDFTFFFFVLKKYIYILINTFAEVQICVYSFDCSLELGMQLCSFFSMHFPCEWIHACVRWVNVVNAHRPQLRIPSRT